MKGAQILINGNQPNGRFEEGTIVGTPAPGTMMELVPATEPTNGRFSYRAVQTGSNGDNRPSVILLEDVGQGVVPNINGSNTYTNGSRGFLYWPVSGDECNVLVESESGTGHHFAIADKLMIDSTNGKLILQDTAAHKAPWMVEETIPAPLSADTLVACKFW